MRSKKVGVKFRKGSKVSWYSQSQGMISRKVGKVFEVLEAGQEPSIRSRYPIPKHPEFRLMYSGIVPRGHRSYIVVVPGKTKGSKPLLYWPHVSNLRSAREGEDMGAFVI